MTDRNYLVDTSVLGRAAQDPVGDRLIELVRYGQMWTCRMIDLEVLYGSRSRDVLEVINERTALPSAPITETVMTRAVHVAGRLAASGQHRGAKPVDLVIAATAESAGLVVLHYDNDYDRIGRVTNQPTQWIAPAESLDG